MGIKRRKGSISKSKKTYINQYLKLIINAIDDPEKKKKLKNLEIDQ